MEGTSPSYKGKYEIINRQEILRTRLAIHHMLGIQVVLKTIRIKKIRATATNMHRMFRIPIFPGFVVTGILFRFCFLVGPSAEIYLGHLEPAWSPRIDGTHFRWMGWSNTTFLNRSVVDIRRTFQETLIVVVVIVVGDIYTLRAQQIAIKGIRQDSWIVLIDRWYRNDGRWKQRTGVRTGISQFGIRILWRDSFRISVRYQILWKRASQNRSRTQ